MATTASLGQFIAAHRGALISRCLLKVDPTDPGKLDDTRLGIPAFLDQLIAELDTPGSMTREIETGAASHGHNLFVRGFTASEVVHVYGSVCQAVTDLAVETKADFSADDFRTLNRCLDDGIAGAVSEYTRQQTLQRDVQDALDNDRAKLALRAAIVAFTVLKTGSVGVGGSTGTLLHRSLLELQRVLRV